MRVAEFRRLDPATRWLVIETLAIVPLVTAALAVLPFRLVVRGVAAAAARGAPRSRQELPPERMAWAVEGVARRVPGARCLAMVLAGKVLFARHARPATVRLGIRREESAVTAHAWLESDGRTILGGPIPPSFTTLPPMEV